MILRFPFAGHFRSPQSRMRTQRGRTSALRDWSDPNESENDANEARAGVHRQPLQIHPVVETRCYESLWQSLSQHCEAEYEVRKSSRSDVSSWHQADLRQPGQARRVIESVKPTHLLHLAWFVVPGKLDFFTGKFRLGHIEL